MSSVRKLADALGVSVATVSRALNNHPDVSEKTKRRVLEAARSAGYVPSVGKRPVNVLGLIYPGDPVDVEFGGFEAAMLSGVLRGANELGYDVTIIALGRDRQGTEEFTQLFHRKGIRGAIVRGIDTRKRVAERITAEGFPCLLLADRSEDPAVSSIDCDSRPTSRQAVEHLIELGHTRIGLGIHNLLDSDHADREQGYVEALEAAGIPRDDTLTVRAPAHNRGGAMMLDRLLELEEPPTAIFFTNPMSTVGALHRCLQLGIRVPQDLSIIGFDDADIRLQTFPAFSAVCQDAFRMGADAARWLIKRLDEDAPHRPETSLHETTLSLHDSTGLKPRTRVRLDEKQQLIRVR
jgi:DNA-binding LacI/PurR family transcriptional regulator